MTEERTLEQLNQTELSKAAEKLVSSEYLNSHSLILDAAMEEYLTEIINDPMESKYDKYVAEMAQNLMDNLRWRKNGAQVLYKIMTTQNAKEIGEEEDEPIEDYLLSVIKESKKDEWALGSLCLEMLETMEQWANLTPEFPELL